MSLFKVSEAMTDSEEEENNVIALIDSPKEVSQPSKRVTKVGKRIEEMHRLIKVIEEALKQHSQNTSEYTSTTTKSSCRAKRAKRTRNFTWTLLDQHLKEAVTNYGYDWTAVAEKVNRPVASVRRRWPWLYLRLNKDKDNLSSAFAEYGRKGVLVTTWSDEMESKLTDAVVAFGSKNWTNISLYCGFGFEEAEYQERWESIKSSSL